MTLISDSIFTVGLTGGIASGKSSVTALFESVDVPVVDADLIAREVVEPGSEGLKSLVATFGNTILQYTNDERSLDRSALRTIIFDDSSARSKIEAILHPLIRERSQQLVTFHADNHAPYVVCAVPLLYETGQSKRYHRIAVVDVSVETQISRVMGRDNTSREAAQKILDSQATREERLSIADDVIKNEGTLTDLSERVLSLDSMYRQLSVKL